MDADGRVWLLLALAEMGGKEARNAVSEGLFDADGRVRQAARTVLRHVVGQRAWANGVRSLVRRTALDSAHPAQQALALEALAEIKEPPSIPLLIEALHASDPVVAQAAAQGLRAITCHALGRDPATWWMWWCKNKTRTRFDWLVDALESDDASQRHTAHSELVRIVGHDLGGGPGTQADARDGAIQAYRQWGENETHHDAKTGRRPRDS